MFSTFDHIFVYLPIRQQQYGNPPKPIPTTSVFVTIATNQRVSNTSDTITQ